MQIPSAPQQCPERGPEAADLGFVGSHRPVVVFPDLRRRTGTVASIILHLFFKYGHIADFHTVNLPQCDSLRIHLLGIDFAALTVHTPVRPHGNAAVGGTIEKAGGYTNSGLAVRRVANAV